MTDVHTKAIRSFNMSRIRSKNTKPELIVRKALFANGFRFRVHVESLPGKPDIVLPKYKAVVFVNGCFWHGHEECKYFVVPKTRTEWWLSKINRNKELDKKNKTELIANGWTVIVLFECELRTNEIESTEKNLINALVKRG